MTLKEEINFILNKLYQFESNQNNEQKQILKAKFCTEVLEKMQENYDEWLEKCPFSIERTSKYISNKYIEFNNINDRLYISCAKFLREYVLCQERMGTRSSWLSGTWSVFKNEAEKVIEPENIMPLKYLISGQFDIDVINCYLGERSYQAFINYEDTVKDIEKKSTELENFLKEREENVNRLARLLEEQKTAFNFVGLSQGFQNLLTEKNYAKWGAFLAMVIISVILISLPAIFIGARFLNWFSEYNIDWSKISWEQMLPIIGLEFVLIYFFRVVLNHYNSIQTQIMQIELRKSLCQFIQSYVEYAKEIKEKDKDALEKFENLIFSSILSTPDKVPSTFDGIDQFTNFFKEIKRSN